jgi:hypothetical protein
MSTSEPPGRHSADHAAGNLNREEQMLLQVAAR